MERIDCSEIKKYLRGEADIYIFDSVSSTNTLALEMLRSEKISPTCKRPAAIIARRQVAGRGRLGRAWFAADNIEGASLCMSVVVPVRVGASGLAAWTVRAGVSICVQLRKLGANVFLKWPNDIYDAHDRKLAGMLSEFDMAGKGEEWHRIIFGVGVNCNFNNVKLPDDLEAIASDVSKVCGYEASVNRCAAVVIDAAIEASDFYNFPKAQSEVSLPAAFAAVDALAGRQVSADIGFNSYSGKACGINDNGELLIKISDSEIVALGSGEASLSKSFRKI